MKILSQHFLIRIFYFLYYFSFLHFTLSHTFHFFFFFFVFLLHTRVHYLYPPSFIFLFSLIQNIPGSSILSFFLQLSLSLSLSLSFSLSLSLLLDSKTLSAIRKFSFSPSFKNIPGSFHLRAVAHLHPQPSSDGSDGFCLLSFYFFIFYFFMI